MSRRITPQGSGQKAVIDIPGIGILVGAGTTVPADATVGYAPGCIFIDTNAALGSQLFVNEGTRASADFNALRAEGGTYTALTVTTLTSPTIVNTTQTRSGAAATDVYIANTALALSVTDGTTTVYALDTRNTIADVSAHVFRAAATTIATAAAAHANPVVDIPARTITYTGTATVTSQLGIMLRTGIPTLTDAAAGTVSLASSVHIAAVAAAGGSLTLTATRMISTSVSDCYLTGAGVWTDTSCWESGKEFVSRKYDEAAGAVGRVLEKITPATWKYKAVTELPSIEEDGSAGVHRTAINDRGRERVGIVYDDLPEELRAPGEERGVSAGILASFALAALRTLYDRNQALEARLAALEAK